MANDEKGRRFYSKDSNGPIYYAYDGDSNRVLYEKDKSSFAVKSYVYDDNGHPLTMIYKGETYHYLTNYRGDVLGMTDASGKLVASYTYDAWGNILTQSGIDHMDSINPYRYAGYRYDEDTKLYYLMARYYNPDTGVFLSLDPVRGDTMNPLTLNGYNYANNNPIINIDPDGEYWKNAWWNKKGFLSKTINAVIFLAAAAVGGSATKILGSYAKKQLSKAKRIVFANSIKKTLIRRGVSANIAAYIVSAVTFAANLAGFYFDPGTNIFNYLDRRDKYPKNGYFNGF
ncbi:RHS repeat-associated core domain-containing protein [Lysinibacillus sp. NPDC097279]|uniref:RHS repeat-associated core domain-containing protein n=1 Tax=Lysinibacillus sp. NPDC097279 TaxID=3364143 RepID=UPI0037F15555